MRTIVKKLMSLLLCLVAVVGTVVVAPITANAAAPSVWYTTHIQDIGWTPAVSNGRVSGTEGRRLRLEAIQIALGNAPAGAWIEYQTHVANIGWQPAVVSRGSSGPTAGTEGRSLAIEAIAIALKNMPGWSVRYRVHVQDIGWMDWQSDGVIAGTVGRGLRTEAIQIELVPAGSQRAVWPTVGGEITQGNTAAHRASSSTFTFNGRRVLGHAIDIAVPVGTSVFATKSGTVHRVADLGNTSFGMYIYLQHDDGTWSAYCHLSRFEVRQGQRVSQGQLIARSGNSGRSTGPHLHFEITDGNFPAR